MTENALKGTFGIDYATVMEFLRVTQVPFGKFFPSLGRGYLFDMQI